MFPFYVGPSISSHTRFGATAGALLISLCASVAQADSVSEGKSQLEKQEFTKAAETFAQGFDKGEGEAGFYLAPMVELGVGFPADQEKARILYLASAEKGSASALNRLGLMHLRGENVRQDFVAAAELICKSADLGNVEGQFNCGGLFLDGTGQQVNASTAFSYYQKAAVEGHVGAKNMLAIMTRQGTGTQADGKKALEMFTEVAALGNPVALFNLAQIYENGEGTPSSPIDAHLYYNLANERGHPNARTALEALTATMTREQLEEAQTRARAWQATVEASSKP